MKILFAQGDLLIEKVEKPAVAGNRAGPAGDGALILAEGETSGHRHAVYGAVTLFHRGTARVVHEEHAPIHLPEGTWRIRRQRELEPREARVVAD